MHLLAMKEQPAFLPHILTAPSAYSALYLRNPFGRKSQKRCSEPSGYMAGCIYTLGLHTHAIAQYAPASTEHSTTTRPERLNTERPSLDKTGLPPS